MRDLYRSTYHRDGTITLWDVYTQGWVRSAQFSDEILASLDWRERDKVLAHIARSAQIRESSPARDLPESMR